MAPPAIARVVCRRVAEGFGLGHVSEDCGFERLVEQVLAQVDLESPDEGLNDILVSRAFVRVLAAERGVKVKTAINQLSVASREKLERGLVGAMTPPRGAVGSEGESGWLDPRKWNLKEVVSSLPEPDETCADALLGLTLYYMTVQDRSIRDGYGSAAND